MKVLLYITAAAALFGQAQTPLKVHQGGSTAGQLWLQEPRSGGTDWLKLRATTMSGDVTYTFPSADGTDNQCLKTDGAGQWSWESCTPERLVSDYDWTQTMGARSGSGAITLTFTGTSCPAAGTDTAYVFRVYESSTPTTYELATSNGTGTCARGGAGTIVATGPTGTYTTAIATSASDGFQEAIFSVADSTHVRARAAIGSYSIYSPILTEDRAVLIECESLGAGLIPRVNSMKVIHTASPTGIRVKNCLFTNAYATTGNTAIYADNPDGANYGGLIEGNWFSSFDKSIHAVTISGWVISKNHFLNSTNATAAIHVENVTNGDQGVGLIHGNILTCGATCTYGLLWNGPGALQFKHNNVNGYTTQVHLQPKFGTASSSGSTVTWQSGNKFRSVLAGQTIYLGSLSASIASVDSDTQITTSTPLGTVATTDYYVNATSQVQISSNNFDSGVNTTKGIRWEGTVSFQNAQIEHNFFSNWSGVASLEAISIASSGVNFLSIRGNNIQSPQATTGTYGIRLTGGSTVSVTDNQVIGSKTAIAIASGASAVTLTGNTCRYNDTACITSAVSDTVLQDQITVAFADLAGLSVANSSRVYCSDCKQSTTACAGSGSGAVATRINSTWQCQDQTSGHQPWTVSGSDVYRSAGNVAIGSAPNTSTLLIKGASGASGLLELKHGTASSSLQLYAESSFSVLGTYTSSPLIFATDSAGRWRLESSGAFRPESDDTYDIGTSSVSPNAIYSHAFSAIAASGDYVRARKLEVHGDSTGSLFDYFQKPTSTSIDLRNTAGNLVMRWDSTGITYNGVSTMYQLWPAGTTETLDLGVDLARWKKLWVKDIDGTGTWQTTGNLSAAAATFTGLTINTGSATVGYCWTATSTGGAGSWQACAGGSSLPVVDTTGIAKGSSDATKIVRFEVDGLTTATTRVLTVPDTDMTLAGRNVAQTFSAAQTVAANLSVTSGSSLLMDRATRATNQQAYWTVAGNPSTTGAWSAGTVPNGAASEFRISHNGTSTLTLSEGGQVDIPANLVVASSGSFGGTATATAFNGTSTNPFRVAGTTIVDSSRNASFANLTWSGTVANSITFSAGSTYNVGSTGAPPLNVYGNYIEPLTELVLGSGVSFRGSLIPVSNNTYAVGNTSFRVSNVATVNMNLSGTLTAPSGSAGITSTKTVRDSAGTGTCTLIFSGGILTGGTC